VSPISTTEWTPTIDTPASSAFRSNAIFTSAGIVIGGSFLRHRDLKPTYPRLQSGDLHVGLPVDFGDDFAHHLYQRVVVS
jgi:hypothetical protein